MLPEGLQPLLPHWSREPGVDAALDALDALSAARGHPPLAATALPLGRLCEQLQALGVDPGYADATGLPLVAEPSVLALAGCDRFGRALWLSTGAARGWQRMRQAASREGVAMDAISGYRSHDYQLGIFKRKRARGIALAQILEVNAAPGYSEHHDGNAIDIGSPGQAPAEEVFEASPAFAWLRAHAAHWGFRLSYPRDNPHGIIYEPWHWYYTDDPV